MHADPVPRSTDSVTVNVRPQRPSCRTTSSGWIAEEAKKRSNAFEAVPQESAVLKCRAVRCRTLSLTSWFIDPLPFSLPIPRCVFLTILTVMREGDGLARQRFRDCLSTLLTYFLLRREISLL